MTRAGRSALLTLFFLLLPPAADAVDFGQAWYGREGDGWDFTAKLEGGDTENAIYRYRATRIDGSESREGRLDVEFRGRRFKAKLRGANGVPLRDYEGLVLDGEPVVTGDVWTVAASGERGERHAWWATVEVGKVAASSSLDLNRATVAELEAIGINPAHARHVVHGRLVEPFRSIDEVLAAPGLSEAEKQTLRAKGIVR